MSKTAIYSLPSGVVVDLSVVKTFNVEEMTNFLGQNMLVVEKASDFFNSANMLALIEAGDTKYRLVAEQAGIVLLSGEVETLRRAKALRVEITEKLAPPIPPYPFEYVPVDWTVESKLVIHNGLVRRLGEANVSYKIGLKTLQKLWDKFSPTWADSTPGNPYGYFTIAGGDRKVVRVNDGLAIGCQTIARYEIEQVALHQGWDFPKVAAK